MSWLSGRSEKLVPDLPPGARYEPDFVTPAEEARLLMLLEQEAWMPDLKRRVQHYGYRYDYKKRALSSEDFIGPLPRWAQVLGERLVEHRVFLSMPDQVIVNEYEPGQGIAPHVDRESCFGEVVASLSLKAPCIMDLSRDTQQLQIVLQPRSLIALSGESRHLWKHGIASRKTDLAPGGGLIQRRRRVSLTFRTVTL